MKEINLLSLIETHRSLEKSLFERFMQSFGITRVLKDYEIIGIESLVSQLLMINNDITVLMHYFLGFSIPQIGKEFDLLRIGSDQIINIEIKKTSTTEKILKQQLRNQYYLSFLGKELLIYTYLSDTKKLYKLVNGTVGNKLLEVSFKELYNKLILQQTITIKNIENLFNPSDYLVSPFNSTDRFMEDKYFLTVQQENIYKDIIKKLNDSTHYFIALTGNAGTGKTLLTYHIAKNTILQGKKVLILHCGPLNIGHHILKEQYGWDIHMPKYAPDPTTFDIILIDEAQRIFPYQFERYKKIVQDNKLKCIFSFDARQYLKDTEQGYAICDRIEKELLCVPYKLTDKIRTNKEIASFIKNLFNINNNQVLKSYSNIDFTYCKRPSSVKSLLDNLSKEGWKTPNYTPGTRSSFHYENYSSNDTDCAHSIVGQEYDKVAIVLDESFKYNDEGKLQASNRYYSQKQMLYQIITRTRKQLYIIILNNPLMLSRICDILKA